LAFLSQLASTDKSLAEQKIDKESGLIIDNNWKLVRDTCTVCHSAKLVTQNRMNRKKWSELIKWMQKEQGLWPLGANEALILDYLSKNYAVLTK